MSEEKINENMVKTIDLVAQLQNVVKEMNNAGITKKSDTKTFLDSSDDPFDKLKEKYKSKKTETISFRVPVDLYKKLDQKAFELRVSVGTLSRDLLEDCVEKFM